MVNIAVIGFGVIGRGVVEIIESNRESIKKHINDEINVKYIVDIADFSGHRLANKIIKDFKTVLNDPEISIVAEMIGGSHPAYDFCLAALEAGKSVVTSNKEVVSNFGPELLAAAKRNGVRYLFEASVGGGIPIIRPMETSLAGNNIKEIDGILNGTSNYILTRMLEAGLSMEEALKEAQANGYAEANSAADVEGTDACRKICILAAVAFGTLIPPQKVKIRGITGVSHSDIVEAEKLNCSIKMIAKAIRLDNGRICITVEPCMVKRENPLSNVSGVFNSVLIKDDAAGTLMFYGKGAGSMPTASSVLSDILDIIEHSGNQPIQQQWTRCEEAYVESIPADMEDKTFLSLPEAVLK